MDGLIPTGFIQHSPEQVFAITAFATVVLLKVRDSIVSAKGY